LPSRSSSAAAPALRSFHRSAWTSEQWSIASNPRAYRSSRRRTASTIASHSGSRSSSGRAASLWPCWRSLTSHLATALQRAGRGHRVGRRHDPGDSAPILPEPGAQHDGNPVCADRPMEADRHEVAVAEEAGLDERLRQRGLLPEWLRGRRIAFSDRAKATSSTGRRVPADGWRRPQPRPRSGACVRASCALTAEGLTCRVLPGFCPNGRSGPTARPMSPSRMRTSDR
jgi:hypothetical protein